MTLWRKPRTEAAGAWRPRRYDLGGTGPDTGGPAVDPGAMSLEGTSGSFFPSGVAGLTDGEPASARSRRVVAVSAFGLLAFAGAAGSYFAVVSGIGGLVPEEPVGAEPYPLSAAQPRDVSGEPANSGLGRGTAHVAERAPTRPANRPESLAEPTTGPARVVPATVPAVAPVSPQVGTPRPRQTTASGEPESRPGGCCLSPPVPTPAAPVPTPAPHSPSASVSPSESPQGSGTPEGSGSPEPSGTPEPAAPAVSAGSARSAGSGEPEPGRDRDDHPRRHPSDSSW